MSDLVFGPDRDPVAEPGTPDGTPGDWERGPPGNRGGHGVLLVA